MTSKTKQGQFRQILIYFHEMNKYYSEIRPQMNDLKSRKTKGVRIVKTLNDFLGADRVKKAKLLDVGSSTGIIDSVLAESFGEVWGIDIDEVGVNFAKKEFKKKNLHFEVGSALKLRFRGNSFDVVVCTHVYEHVSNPKKLFNEIYRVLKPGGVCYLAAINALWPMEPHYNLLFLSWLPKSVANIYVKLFGKSDKYWENPMFRYELTKLVKKFRLNDYTGSILSYPQKFGYQNQSIPKIFSSFLRFVTPTFFWLLVKENG